MYTTFPSGRLDRRSCENGGEETKLFWINEEDCIRCGACIDACPVDAISLQKANCRTRVVGDRGGVGCDGGSGARDCRGGN